MSGVSLQSCTVGPVYIFRNVIAHGEKFVDHKHKGGTFFKFSGNDHSWGGKKTSKEAFFWGPVYVYHNISIIPDDTGFATVFKTFSHDDTRNVISRNNVWVINKKYVTSTSKKDHPKLVNCSFDYDLHSQDSTLVNNEIVGFDQHGIQADPQWRVGTLPITGINGNYQLEKGSKGTNAGVSLPNFNHGDKEEGGAPDMGVQESDSPDQIFGLKALWDPLYSAKSAH